MATTTMELRHLLQLTDPVTGLPFDLFDFDYTVDDLAFKTQIEQAVIDYYYFSEIGQETPARFKHVFRRRWLQMIGYYNRIHNADLIEYDPLITYRMEETFTGENIAEQVANAKRDATLHRGGTMANTGTTTVSNDGTSVTAGDTTTTDNNTTKTTDYPQQVIGSGYQNGESQYAGTVTNANDVTTTTGSDGTETVNLTETADTTDTTDALDITTINDTKNDTYTKLTEGFTGRGFNSVGLVQQYMESIPRLTGQIIDEMKPCFMLVH